MGKHGTRATREKLAKMDVPLGVVISRGRETTACGELLWAGAQVGRRGKTLIFIEETLCTKREEFSVEVQIFRVYEMSNTLVDAVDLVFPVVVPKGERISVVMEKEPRYGTAYPVLVAGKTEKAMLGYGRGRLGTALRITRVRVVTEKGVVVASFKQSSWGLRRQLFGF